MVRDVFVQVHELMTEEELGSVFQVSEHHLGKGTTLIQLIIIQY